jgi:hypothetical protein
VSRQVNRGVLACLVGGVVFIALTMLFHRVTFPEQGREFAERLNSDTPLMLLPAFIYTGVLAYLFSLVYRGGSPAFEGYRLGACSGLIVIPTFTVIMIRIGVEPWFAALDLLWHVLVQQALTGMVVGLVCGPRPQVGS